MTISVLCVLAHIFHIFGIKPKLIISAFLCQFVVGFTVINELFLLNNFCTFFIVSAHILGIYIFMKFLVEQDPTTIQDSIKKHLL